MPRPCQRQHPTPEAWQHDCHLCWLFLHEAGYRALWSGNTRGEGPCRHLGPETGKVVQCPTCRGHVRLKVFACAVHGEGTVGKALPGLACCAGCPDYDPGPDRPEATSCGSLTDDRS